MIKREMKFGFARKIALLFTLLVFCACFFAHSAIAFANSAPMYVEGSAGAGAQVMGDCPFIVEHELLSFDIDIFPDTRYPEEDIVADYTARVTAQYDFYNPTDSEFTATLAFPFGDIPRYFGFEQLKNDASGYGVTIDGQPAQVTLRHTFLGDKFDIDTDIKRLRNDYAADEFFKRDLTVTVYEYVFDGIEKLNKNYYAPYAAAFFEKTSERKILLSDSNGGDYEDTRVRVGKFVENGDAVTVYAVGKPFDVLPEWKVYKNGGSETVISGEATLVSTRTVLFEDMALQGYSEENGISRTDYYNAFVDYCNEYKKDFVGTVPDIDTAYDFMRWYIYELTLPAKTRAVNTVTAPVYPDINGAYSPGVYTYEYLLSPAKKWQSFGAVDIELNTPFYIQNDSLGFVRNEKGYSLSFDSLPDGELEFSLCSAQNPESVNGAYYPLFKTGQIIFIIMLSLIAILIVGGVIYFAATSRRSQ